MPRRKKARKKWWQIDGLTPAACVLAVAAGYLQEVGKTAWHASEGGLTILVETVRPSRSSLPNKPVPSKRSYDDTWTDSGIGRLTSIDYGGGGYDLGGGSDFDYGGGSTHFDPAGSTHFNPAGSTYFDSAGSLKSRT